MIVLRGERAAIFSVLVRRIPLQLGNNVRFHRHVLANAMHVLCGETLYGFCSCLSALTALLKERNFSKRVLILVKQAQHCIPSTLTRSVTGLQLTMVFRDRSDALPKRPQI